MVRSYWRTILSVDDSVGRPYALLGQRGELDRTVFIFTSDKGLLNGEHGMLDKRTAHGPSIRVPLVVRYPGLTAPMQPRVVYEKQSPYTPNLRALRTEDWKYVRYPNSPKQHLSELCDLKNDPDELVNLINDTRHRYRVKRMHDRLDRQLVRLKACPDNMPLDEGIGTALPARISGSARSNDRGPP